MTKHRHHTAVANYVPSRIADTPYPDIESQPNTVVQADNRASEPQVLALAVLILFLLGSIGVWSFYMLTGWNLWAIIMLVLCLIAVGGFLILLVVNGDWLAWREIANRSKNQRIAILEHADLLQNSETHRHTEEMRRLDIQEAQVQIDGRLQSLQHQIEGMSRRLLTNPDTNPGPTPAQYVQADPDKERAKTVALEYAVSLYDHRGERGPNPQKVHVEGSQPGKIKGATPFSKRSKWPDGVDPDVGKRATELLFQPDRGQPPVIVSIPGGYALNLAHYPTRHSVWQKFA